MSIQGDSRGPLGSAISIDLGTIGDTFVPIPVGKFIPRNITATNASATLAASTAQLALYTGAAASGTAIVAPAVLTSLTASTLFSDRTIVAGAVATTVFTPTYNATEGAYGIYARVTVAGTAGTTCDLHVFGDAVK